MQDKNPYAPAFDALPATLPVFPLSGVLLLPHGNLPLNIFEPRYLQMVEDALAGDRLIGMIQSKNETGLQSVGCAGRITEFSQTPDNRFLINLTGIARFQVSEELSVTTPYRQVAAQWQPYEHDLVIEEALDLKREMLVPLLEEYFALQEIEYEAERLHKASDSKLITCLSMVCPFDAKEKQALLEAENGQARARLFTALLEMEVKAAAPGNLQH